MLDASEVTTHSSGDRPLVVEDNARVPHTFQEQGTDLITERQFGFGLSPIATALWCSDSVPHGRTVGCPRELLIIAGSNRILAGSDLVWGNTHLWGAKAGR